MDIFIEIKGITVLWLKLLKIYFRFIIKDLIGSHIVKIGKNNICDRQIPNWQQLQYCYSYVNQLYYKIINQRTCMRTLTYATPIQIVIGPKKILPNWHYKILLIKFLMDIYACKHIMSLLSIKFHEVLLFGFIEVPNTIHNCCSTIRPNSKFKEA